MFIWGYCELAGWVNYCKNIYVINKVLKKGKKGGARVKWGKEKEEKEKGKRKRRRREEGYKCLLYVR
jgi:hypothetical protein